MISNTFRDILLLTALIGLILNFASDYYLSESVIKNSESIKINADNITHSNKSILKKLEE